MVFFFDCVDLDMLNYLIVKMWDIINYNIYRIIIYFG